MRFRSSFTSVNLVNGDGTIVDLSLRGCRISSPTEVNPGTTLALRIHTSGDASPLQVDQGVVRWCRNQQFGIEFVTLQPEEWARLQHTVKDLEREPYQRESDEHEASTEQPSQMRSR